MYHLSCILLFSFFAASHAYDLVRDYSGSSFFNGWDFYGSWDNLTLGDAWWLNEEDAFSQGLASVNQAGNAIVKVDNVSNVPWNDKRNTVRITTQDFYSLGSLWIIDLLHMPFGCSVWPAFWSKGLDWPYGGEIDIIEGVNLMSANQMALHTIPGCMHTTPPTQIGASGIGPGADCSTASGCIVAETKPSSFGSAFASSGGGVWATQFDVAGIFIWYWPRSQVPASIQQATSTSSIDLSDWGNPSASYLNSSCPIYNFFTDQQLVLDITLCGDWAGIGPVYNQSCLNAGPAGVCYLDNVIGPGSPKYDNAFFEISYVRAYTTFAPTPTFAQELSPTNFPSPIITPFANFSQPAVADTDPSSDIDSSSLAPSPTTTASTSGSWGIGRFRTSDPEIFLWMLLAILLLYYFDDIFL